MAVLERDIWEISTLCMRVVHMHVYMYVREYVCTYVCMHSYIHIYTHAYIHTLIYYMDTLTHAVCTRVPYGKQ